MALTAQNTITVVDFDMSVLSICGWDKRNIVTGGPPAWLTKLVNPVAAPKPKAARWLNPAPACPDPAPRPGQLKHRGKARATAPINTRIASSDTTVIKTAPNAMPGMEPQISLRADGLSHFFQ